MFNRKSENEKPVKNNAKAFINWGIADDTGKVIYKGDKGLPLFQNPEYPSVGEDQLIAMAEARGGSVELTLKVRVNLNAPKDHIGASDLLKQLGLAA